MNLHLSLKISDFGPYPVYTGFGMSYHEEFLQKYFFRKAHTILNIFHIYNFALKWILPKLQAIEISSKNMILSLNLSKIFTSGLAELTVMLCTKGAVERRQNLRFWCIWVMCDIWWAVFKKATLRALPLIFRSEMLPNDLIPVFENLICNPKQSSRTSWFVGPTLHIPSF